MNTHEIVTKAVKTLWPYALRDHQTAAEIAERDNHNEAVILRAVHEAIAPLEREVRELRDKLNREVEAVQCEEELDGPMPDSIWNMLSTREGATEVLRANIRATKKNIIERIQKL